MNSIRFTSKEDFIDALEGRRKFWHDYDAKRTREHKAAEQKWLTDARTRMRAALKLDYEQLSKKAEYGNLPFGTKPKCPVLMEAKIDVVLASLIPTGQKTFLVDSIGNWADAHQILTWDPNAKKTVC